MTFFDKLIQQYRIRKALRYIPRDAFVLDIGSHDGVLFKAGADKNINGIGIDPSLAKEIVAERYQLIRDSIENWHTEDNRFDIVCMLAVLEHIVPASQKITAQKIFAALKRNGKLIITVPDKRVDHILAVLQKLKLVAGMSLEQHYGFEVADTERIFIDAGFSLVAHKKFQLGLNNLFIFQKN